MLRSMYSGISGMKVNQTKLDVIGNNISNVGTTSFKSSNARFSDMLSQSVSNAMSPSNNSGGINAKQVGLGVQLSSISTVMTQGTMQPTNRALDVAIDGEGYFMVSKGPKIFDGSLQVNHQVGSHTITEQSLENSTSQIVYSRDGSFTLDEEGNLLTSDGYRILGYSLTNDDSAREATGLSPNPVKAGGLDFVFGPGSQLNGYKVVLGSIGPNTTTSASVNNSERIITVNGDFATTGALTPAQVESAVNKALSSAGISQSVSVSGSTTNVSNLTSEAVLGGVDAKAASPVAVGGFTVEFGPGSDLEGYKVVLNKIGAAPSTVNVTNNEIVINAVAGESATNINTLIKSKLEGLTPAKTTTVKVDGSMSSSLVVGTRYESGEILGGLDKKSATNVLSVAGIDLGLSEGASLNGYKFVVGKVSPGTATDAEVNTAAKTITINADFVTGSLETVAVQNAINAALAAKGINQSVTAKEKPMILSEALVVSPETLGGTPIESITEDGSLLFVDATKDLKSYDGELKTLRIPEKVRIAGSDVEMRIKTYTIDASGIINGVLEDGRVAALGQIAMASFRNTEGLSKLGGNLYSSSVNSGEAVIKSGIGTVNDDNSNGYGDNLQGMLEMSNVDLAEQFTDMIVASRAFQAAGKMITTGDEILQDIINLKR